MLVLVLLRRPFTFRLPGGTGGNTPTVPRKFSPSGRLSDSIFRGVRDHALREKPSMGLEVYRNKCGVLDGQL